MQHNRDNGAMERDELIDQIVLNKYRILKELARGGMGVVYLARVEGAEGFVRPVVVKRILPQLASDSSYLGMFVREAQIMVNLKDQGIASVLDFAEEGGSYIMVLEYVRGYQLRQWIEFLAAQQGSIPTPVISQIMINVLDALHHVHTAKDHSGAPLNIVHRDICPSNVLIDTEGHTKIVDFGIGVIAGAQHRGYKTQVDTQFKGKLLYGAPELFANQPASPRTDVYAAAVMMHEMLVGQNEFQADSDAGVLSRVMHHQPSPVYANRQDATLELDEVIQKGLQKNPEERYQTAAAFADALREIHPLTEREGGEMLRSAAGEAFTEEMALFVGEESLEERDRVWSTYQAPDPPRQSSTGEYSRPNLLDSGITDQAALPAHRSRWVAPLIAALVVVLGVVGVGGWFFLNNRGQDQDIYIVSAKNTQVLAQPVAPRPTPEDSVAAQAAADAPQAADAVHETNEAEKDTPPQKTERPKRSRAAKKAPARTTPRSSSPEELGRIFSKKRPQILRCMKKNPNDIPASAKLNVRLHIAASGSVDGAEVSPSDVALTNAGKCIEKVAKSAVFPPQKERLKIRVPINVSIGSSR